MNLLDLDWADLLSWTSYLNCNGAKNISYTLFEWRKKDVVEAFLPTIQSMAWYAFLNSSKTQTTMDSTLQERSTEYTNDDLQKFQPKSTTWWWSAVITETQHHKDPATVRTQLQTVVPRHHLHLLVYVEIVCACQQYDQTEVIWTSSAARRRTWNNTMRGWLFRETPEI